MATARREVAVVSGAGRGIGRAIALAFARAGYNVVVGARTENEIRDVASEAGAFGCRALPIACDVSRPEGVRTLVGGALDTFGEISSLVNCAGISPMRNGSKVPIDEMTLEQWQEVIGVNLTGAFLLTQAAVTHMRRAGRGSITNIASAAARTGGIAAGAHYVASKAGLVGFTKVCAREFGAYGVRVNAIAPGRIESAMLRMVSIDPEWANREVPLGRMGSPQDIADVAVFLASDGARYITGATIDVNGGWVMH